MSGSARNAEILLNCSKGRDSERIDDGDKGAATFNGKGPK